MLLWFLVFTKNIFSVTFDETFARAAGVKTGAFNIALAVLTGITIVVWHENDGIYLDFRSHRVPRTHGNAADKEF